MKGHRDCLSGLITFQTPQIHSRLDFINDHPLDAIRLHSMALAIYQFATITPSNIKRTKGKGGRLNDAGKRFQNSVAWLFDWTEDTYKGCSNDIMGLHSICADYDFDVDTIREGARRLRQCHRGGAACPLCRRYKRFKGRPAEVIESAGVTIEDLHGNEWWFKNGLNLTWIENMLRGMARI